MINFLLVAAYKAVIIAYLLTSRIQSQIVKYLNNKYISRIGPEEAQAHGEKLDKFRKAWFEAIIGSSQKSDTKMEGVDAIKHAITQVNERAMMCCGADDAIVGVVLSSVDFKTPVLLYNTYLIESDETLFEAITTCAAMTSLHWEAIYIPPDCECEEYATEDDDDAF